MDADHLKHSISSRKPLTHEDLDFYELYLWERYLHEGFSFKILLVMAQLDSQLFSQLSGLVLLDVHDGIEHLSTSCRSGQKIEPGR